MEMITTRHEITGHVTDFPADVIDAHRALGWIPIAELEARELEAPEPAADSADSSDETTSAPTTKPAARKRANESEE